MKFIHKKFDLLPIIVVYVWNSRLVDVGVT
jgi:hypothetical protein